MEERITQRNGEGTWPLLSVCVWGVIVREGREGNEEAHGLLFVPLGGEMRAGRALMNLEFTFDLFVCVAILTMHSGKICDSTDAASVYGCLNR